MWQRKTELIRIVRHVFCVYLAIYLGVVAGCSSDKDCPSYETKVNVMGKIVTMRMQEYCCPYITPRKCMRHFDRYGRKCLHLLPNQTEPTIKTSTVSTKTVSTRPATQDEPNETTSSDSDNESELSTGIIVSLTVGFSFAILFCLLIVCVRYKLRIHIRANPISIDQVLQNQPQVANSENDAINIIITELRRTEDPNNHTMADNLGGMMGSASLTERGGVSPSGSGEEPPSYKEVYIPSPPLQTTNNLDNLPPPPKYEDVV